MAERDSSGVLVFQRDESGLILMGYFTGAVPSDASKFAPGCFLIGSNGKQYANSGSAASPTFQDINVVSTGEIENGAITGAKLSMGAGYYSVAVTTNGTTPVNVFGQAGAPMALTVTSVMSQAIDTTASNIIMKQGANTVASIAKGTAVGVVVSEDTIANNVFAPGDVCTVESSSTGNSVVIITFTVA